jgi:hypothetical protein
MKNKAKQTLLFIALSLAAFATTASAQGTLVARTADDIFGIISRVSGRSLDEISSAAFRQADTAMVDRALRQFGPGIGEVFERGGYGLLAAGRQYGDDVFRIAHNVPDASRLLAADPSLALNIARTYGEDALRVEALMRGFMQRGGRHLGTYDFRYIAELPQDAAKRLAGTVARTNDAAAARQVIDMHRKYGDGFLGWVRQHPRVAAGGAITVGLLGEYAVRGDDSILALFGKIFNTGKEIVEIIMNKPFTFLTVIASLLASVWLGFRLLKFWLKKGIAYLRKRLRPAVTPSPSNP